MNIRPLHDRVIVRRMEEERLSAGGIVHPGLRSREAYSRRGNGNWHRQIARQWHVAAIGVESRRQGAVR